MSACLRCLLQRMVKKTWVGPYSTPSELRCYHGCKLKWTLFLIYFRLVAAIFDFAFTQTSGWARKNLRFAWHRKHGGSRCDLVAISCASLDLCYCVFRAHLRFMTSSGGSRNWVRGGLSGATVNFVLKSWWPCLLLDSISIVTLTCCTVILLLHQSTIVVHPIASSFIQFLLWHK